MQATEVNTGDGPQKERKPQKSQQQILRHTQEAVLTQLERTNAGLILSGFSAGLDVGFSVLLMSTILSLFNGIFPQPVVQFMVGNMYPIGFIFVILGRSELFTEHTTLAILPVLEGASGIKQLLRLWFYVYFSNIIGGAVFSFILSYFAGGSQILKAWALKEISANMIAGSWHESFVSAILAGWLMGLLAWLVAAARETISQLFLIWVITAAIGIAGLHHCIVGNVEVLAGLLVEGFSLSSYLRFLIPATLGNIVGGAVFVGVLKFSHTIFSGEEKELPDKK